VDLPDPYAMHAEIKDAKKRVNCCATGCLGVVVLGFLIILCGIWYLYSGRDPVPPTTLMAEDAHYMLVLRFDFDDEASAAFISAAKNEFITTEKSAEKVLNALEHLSPGWIVMSSKTRPSYSSNPPLNTVWAITYTHWWRILDMTQERIARENYIKVGTYSDTEIYQKKNEEPPYLVMRENSVLHAWKLSSMHTVIEQIASGKPASSPLAGPAAALDWSADITALSAETPQSLGAYGVSDVVSGTPVYVLEIDLKSKTVAQGRLQIILDSETDAQKACDALAGIAEGFGARYGVSVSGCAVSGSNVQILFDCSFSDPTEFMELMKQIILP
jgi:hypothetical protein